jgi:hypothetical protein
MQRVPLLPTMLLTVTTLGAVVLGFLSLSAEHAVLVARHSAPWLQLTILALFAGFLWRVIPWSAATPRALWQKSRWGMVLIALCAAFIVSREPADFKITNDELVLAATAMELHFGREPTVLWRGYEVMGVFEDLGKYLDKRPLLFPFLVSLVHDATGFRLSNAFFLNRALTLLLAALLYTFAFRVGGSTAGNLSLLLLAGIPLLAQNASGGGFEILNLVLILLAMHCAVSLLARPGCSTQGAFVFSLLLLAHTRYESGMFVIAGVVVVLVSWWRQHAVTIHWPLVVAPLGLVTLPLQMRVFELHGEGFWQLPPGVETPFSLDFLTANLGHAARFLFIFGRRTYSSPLVASLGALAAVFVVLYLIRARRQRTAVPDAVKVLFLFSATTAVILLVTMCYHWGQLTKYESSRFALPILLASTLLAVWAVVEMRPSRTLLSVVAIVFLSNLYAFSIPASATRLGSLRHHPVRRMNWEWQQFKQHSGGRSLVITNDSLFFLIHRVSAIPPWIAEFRLAQVDYHVRSKSFTDVLVFQLLRVDPATGDCALLHDHGLSAAYELEPVAEASFRPWVVCRLSRVVAIDPSRHGPLPARRDPQPRDPGFDMEPYQVDEINAFIRQFP